MCLLVIWKQRLIPCVLGRLCRRGIKGGCCVEFAYPLPVPFLAVLLTAGPLKRFWQGKKKGADMVEEINKPMQAMARVEKKLEGIRGP